MKCTEKVSFFAEMITNQESEKHEECCKAMGYKLASHGETIVKEGTIGQTFYIILKGMVGIYKGESVELSGSNTSIKDVDTNAKSMTKKTSLLLKPVSQAQNLRRYSTKALETQYNPDNLNKIKVLKAGEAFGELSLMENKPRAATVICEQECHLAILEKQYFDKILSKINILLHLNNIFWF
jgi:CRP-like cAMP-binding protein